jgi:ferredoxin
MDDAVRSAGYRRDFCHVGVFRIEEKDGNQCSVLCRGCEDVCPAGAITHPSEEETQKIIDKQKKDKV